MSVVLYSSHVSSTKQLQNVKRIIVSWIPYHYRFGNEIYEKVTYDKAAETVSFL